MPLVCVVARRVQSFSLGGHLVVATDDGRVARAVAAVGVPAVLTSPHHRSGTERVAEVLARPAYRGVDVVLNVQGDEPFVPAAAVHGALAWVRQGLPVGTAAAPLAPERAGDPHRVKVSVNAAGWATGFSRAPLPAGAGASPGYLQHLGVYAYGRRALLDWVRLPPAGNEQAERLEQLRPLAHGLRIGVAVLHEEAPPGIDTEEDLATADAWLAEAGSTGAASFGARGDLG